MHLIQPLLILTSLLPCAVLAQYAGPESQNAITFPQSQAQQSARLLPELDAEFFGLLELENSIYRLQLLNGQQAQQSSPVATLQLGLQLQPVDGLTGIFVLEFEDDVTSEWSIDEALLTWQQTHWALTVGRFYSPFGVFYSHFITDPMVLLAETQADQLQIEIHVSEQFALNVFALKSEVSLGQDSQSLDWGASLSWHSTDDAIQWGVSYLSDLAESDEGLLEELDASLIGKLPALSSHLLVVVDAMEFSAEWVKAFPSHRAPMQSVQNVSFYNVEWAWSPIRSWSFLTRYERSQHIVTLPKTRWGIGGRKFLMEEVSLALEYFYGSYSAHPDGLNYEHLMAGQLSWEW